MTKLTEVTLENLAGGGAQELFARELRRVLENIQDANTEAEAKRSITMEVLFSPSEDREGAKLGVVMKSKIAPSRPLGTNVFIGERNGSMVAVGFDPRQREIFGEDEDPSVRPLPRQQSATT